MHSTVFEYGYLCANDEVSQLRGYSRVSGDTFRYLRDICLGEAGDQALPFLTLKSHYSQEVIQVRNYVGVICTPHGEQVEILPKHGRVAQGESAVMARQQARKQLLVMLQYLGEFRHLSSTIGDVDTIRMPLLEVFITQFLEAVSLIVKRGLRADYLREQDNLFYLKGRLQLAKQLRHNLVNQHRFYVEFDEYQYNRPANRLIHAALEVVAHYSRSLSNQRLLRELSFAFADIPVSRDVAGDFTKLRIDRGMGYYQSAIDWARLILNGLSPLAMQGSAKAISLLFPMETVFESYVAAMLAKQLPTDLRLSAQASNRCLVSHQGQDWFRLCPDLLIEHEESGAVAVLDTKWKVIDSRNNNSRDKYGLLQNDFYQMLAYGQKYLGGVGELFLIYPAHEQFREPITHYFGFDDQLKLWVVPFVTDTITGVGQVTWPSGSRLLK
ncbi:McrC family protein [Aliagarivorans marinus]|uniref:McrC family protein n=1 Tax=Aliagarivorans marinus TaxID=561965 RepID=UPI00041685C7|nr:McrC family protein [Aliagarivorans marinus]